MTESTKFTWDKLIVQITRDIEAQLREMFGLSGLSKRKSIQQIKEETQQEV